MIDEPDDPRLERERLDAFRDSMDRSFGERGDCLQVMVGRVFNAGAIPTTIEKYFAVHPVIPGGAETEGGAGSNTVLSSAVAYVLVLGPEVPVAGDDLVCYQVGDRWVAQYGGADDTPTVPCGVSCPIPVVTLDLAYGYDCSGPILSHNPLVHTTTRPAWLATAAPAGLGHYWEQTARAGPRGTGCLGGGTWWRFAVWCAGSGPTPIVLYGEFYPNATDPKFSGSTGSPVLNNTGGTCEPFHMTYHNIFAPGDTFHLTAP